MSDYINYFVFNAIKLGELAYEIGDYDCAFQNYSKALAQLRNYRGDRMPTTMASELVDKIEATSNRIKSGTTILRFENWKLTKSSFVKGNQCVKFLYLDKHKKNEKTPVNKETQKLFDQGHSFEHIVRETEFPGGVNVKEAVGNFAYFNSYTQYLLNTPERRIIYEATLIENEVLVMCDILIKNNDGLIDIYEIKHSTKLNEAIIEDLYIQFLVAKTRFKEALNTFNVILRSEADDRRWTIKNLKEELENYLPDTTEKVKRFKNVLISNEPVIAIGPQCNKPYTCDFIDYCKNRC